MAIASHTFVLEVGDARGEFTVTWDTGALPATDPDGYPNMADGMPYVGALEATVTGAGSLAVRIYRRNNAQPWREDVLTAGSYSWPFGGPVRNVGDVTGYEAEAGG